MRSGRAKPAKLSLREIQHRERSERILDVANRLFKQHGYGLVSIEEIAAEAVISRATLYSYFRSKEEIAVQLSLRAIAEVVEFVDSIDRGQPAKNRLHEFIDWAVEYRFGKDPKFTADLTRATTPVRTPELLAADRGLTEGVSKLIAAAQEAGDVRRDIQAPFLGALMLGTMHAELDDMIADKRITTQQIADSWKALLLP